MRPWREHRVQPDITGIYQTQGAWSGEVETILSTLGQIAMHAWSEASNVPPVSRHSFVMASLAQTENLLVRIPDDVYNLVFAEITESVNAGENKEQLANRVDQLLSYTGSERWPNRARVIAQTETTRAYGAGTLAAGMEQARVTGRLLTKIWDAREDGRTRLDHQEVDGTRVGLWMPFYVGRFPMMFPGDPVAPADLVVNCRCVLRIADGRA
jgi:uncharacterized protein with gpF-like domain